MKPVPCPACAEPMDVKPDVKGRPYGACYPCGAQVFVKGARGVVEFEKRYGKDWKAGKPNAAGEAAVLPAPVPTSAPAPARKPSKSKPAPAATPAPEPTPKQEQKRESILDKHIL